MVCGASVRNGSTRDTEENASPLHNHQRCLLRTPFEVSSKPELFQEPKGPAPKFAGAEGWPHPPLNSRFY